MIKFIVIPLIVYVITVLLYWIILKLDLTRKRPFYDDVESRKAAMGIGVIPIFNLLFLLISVIAGIIYVMFKLWKKFVYKYHLDNIKKVVNDNWMKWIGLDA